MYPNLACYKVHNTTFASTPTWCKPATASVRIFCDTNIYLYGRRFPPAVQWKNVFPHHQNGNRNRRDYDGIIKSKLVQWSENKKSNHYPMMTTLNYLMYFLGPLTFIHHVSLQSQIIFGLLLQNKTIHAIKIALLHQAKIREGATYIPSSLPRHNSILFKSCLRVITTFNLFFFNYNANILALLHQAKIWEDTIHIPSSLPSSDSILFKSCICIVTTFNNFFFRVDSSLYFEMTTTITSTLSSIVIWISHLH